MIDFATGFAAWTAATFLPALAGVALIAGVGKFLNPKYLAAFGFGIFLWFFVDTIGGSANLDVNSGFTGGLAQLGVVFLFIIGVLFFFILGRKQNIFTPESAIGRYGIVIPFFVAAAVGIHGLGEGWAFGATACCTISTNLLDAFGGPTAGVAYVLHKGLEPMMVGACYAVYAKERIRTALGWIGDILFLSVVFVFTSILGAGLGYFISVDTTYFFALGTGTSIYAAIRLAGALFVPNQGSKERETVALGISIVLGFLAIYVAALFHS